MECKMTERGMGLPCVGDYVEHVLDRTVYKVTAMGPVFMRPDPGMGDYCCATVDQADWSDLDEDPFPVSLEFAKG
jgi:hypothetical protein